VEGAADYLNIPRPHDRIVLVPLHQPGPSPLPSRRTLPCLSAAGAGWVDGKLVAKASHEQADGGEYVWLARASKQCVRPLLDILTLLFDGKLAQIRLDPLERGFKSILVNLDKVRGHLHAPRATLSLRDVEHRLKATSPQSSSSTQSATCHRGNAHARLHGFLHQPTGRHGLHWAPLVVHVFKTLPLIETAIDPANSARLNALLTQTHVVKPLIRRHAGMICVLHPWMGFRLLVKAPKFLPSLRLAASRA
jgi:hypothetical protein